MGSRARVKKIVSKISSSKDNVEVMLEQVKLISEADDYDVDGSVREEFGGLGIMGILCSILTKHRLNEQVQEHTIGAISDLTFNCPSNKIRADASGALDIAMEALRNFRGEACTANAVTLIGNLSAVPELVQKIYRKRDAVLPLLASAMKAHPRQADIMRSAVVTFTNMITFVDHSRPEVARYIPDIVTALRNNKMSPEAMSIIAGFIFILGEEELHNFRSEGLPAALLDLVQKNVEDFQLMQFITMVLGMLVAAYEETREEALVGNGPTSLATLINVAPNTDSNFFRKFPARVLSYLIGGTNTEHALQQFCVDSILASPVKVDSFPEADLVLFTPKPEFVQKLVQGGVVAALVRRLSISTSNESVATLVITLIYFLVLNSPEAAASFRKANGVQTVKNSITELKRVSKEYPMYGIHLLKTVEKHSSPQVSANPAPRSNAPTASTTTTSTTATASTTTSASPTSSATAAAAAPAAASAPANTANTANAGAGSSQQPTTAKSKQRADATGPTIPFGMTKEELESLAKELMAEKPGSRPAKIAELLKKLQEPGATGKEVVQILAALTEAAELLANVIVEQDGVKVLLALVERCAADAVLLGPALGLLATIGTKSEEGRERMSRKAFAPAVAALSGHPEQAQVQASVCKLLSQISRSDDMVDKVCEAVKPESILALLGKEQSDPLVRQEASFLLMTIVNKRSEASQLLSHKAASTLIGSLKELPENAQLVANVVRTLTVLCKEAAHASAFLDEGVMEALTRIMRRHSKNERIIEDSCILAHTLLSPLIEVDDRRRSKAVASGLHKEVSKALGWPNAGRPLFFFSAVVNAAFSLSLDPAASMVLSDSEENLERILITLSIQPTSQSAVHTIVNALNILTIFCRHKKTTLKRLLALDAIPRVMACVMNNKTDVAVVTVGLATLALCAPSIELGNLESMGVPDAVIDCLQSCPQDAGVLLNGLCFTNLVIGNLGTRPVFAYGEALTQIYVEAMRAYPNDASIVHLCSEILKALYNCSSSKIAECGARFLVKVKGIDAMANVLKHCDKPDIRRNYLLALVSIALHAGAEAALSEDLLELLLTKNRAEASLCLSCIANFARTSVQNAKVMVERGFLDHALAVFLGKEFDTVEEKQFSISAITQMFVSEPALVGDALVASSTFLSSLREGFRRFVVGEYTFLAMSLVSKLAGRGAEVTAAILRHDFVRIAMDGMMVSYIDYARASITFLTAAVRADSTAFEAVLQSDPSKKSGSGIVRAIDRLQGSQGDPETSRLLCDLLSAAMGQSSKRTVDEILCHRGVKTLVETAVAHPQFGGLVQTASEIVSKALETSNEAAQQVDTKSLATLADKCKSDAAAASAVSGVLSLMDAQTVGKMKAPPALEADEADAASGAGSEDDLPPLVAIEDKAQGPAVSDKVEAQPRGASSKKGKSKRGRSARGGKQETAPEVAFNVALRERQEAEAKLKAKAEAEAKAKAEAEAKAKAEAEAKAKAEAEAKAKAEAEAKAKAEVEAKAKAEAEAKAKAEVEAEAQPEETVQSNTAARERGGRRRGKGKKGSESAQEVGSQEAGKRATEQVDEPKAAAVSREPSAVSTGTLQTFALEELKTGTNNFSPQSILSEDGGFGPVYRGVVRGLRVAVKIMQHVTPDSKEHFYRELETLSRCRHENILPLLGSFCADDCWCLVYTLCVNGSLRAALDRSSAAPELLPWRKRTCIMVEVLRGLNYLHNLVSPPIVHRDVKSANVLLNHAMSACLGDFGIARAVNEVQNSQNAEKKHVSTRILGTPGYIDPEYARTGRVTLASDVFGAGVIMSELLSSRPAHASESDPPDITSLFEEMQEEEKPVDSFVDKDAQWLADANSRRTAADMVAVAMRCMNGRGKNRPSTTDLLGELEKLASAAGALPDQLHAAKADSTGGECVVCFSAKPNNAFIPCGHCCVCSECAKQQWSECPMCRTPVQKTIQIFF